jgi:hypothetical protein
MGISDEAARLEREGECVLSGYLYKKARGMNASIMGTILQDHSWKERDFYLYASGQLVYFASATEVKGIYDLSGARVDKLLLPKHLPEGARCAIEIKNKDGEGLSLAADAEWRLDKWVAEIRAVASGEWKPEQEKHKSTPAARGLAKKSLRRQSRKATTPEVSRKLNEYMKSQICADCGATRPVWASVNVGVLICTLCSGVHRSLGVQVSFVKSITMDTWTIEQADEFVDRKGGPNETLNRVLEYHVPPVGVSSDSSTEGEEGGYYKPHSTSARALREKYIRAKYADRKFCPDEGDGTGTEDRKEKGELAPQTDPSPRTEQADDSAPFIGFLVVKLLSLRVNGASDETAKNERCPWFVEVATGKQFLNNKDHRRTREDRAIRGDEGDEGRCAQVVYEDSALLLGWSGLSPLRLKILDSSVVEKERAPFSLLPELWHRHGHMGKVAEAEIDISELPDYEALEHGEDVTANIKLGDFGLLHIKISFVPG